MTARSRRPRPGTLERSVVGAVAVADWLTESDAAAVWLTRDTALAWDMARRQGSLLQGGPWGSARDIAEMAGRLLVMLRELGLTPAARHRLGLWNDTADDAFAELISLARAPGGHPAG